MIIKGKCGDGRCEKVFSFPVHDATVQCPRCGRLNNCDLARQRFNADERQQELADLRQVAGVALATDQPAPVANSLPAAWDLVMTDMRTRDRFGKEKYGVRLQPENGRDFLADAYQEALDLAVYLRGALYERDGK